MGEWLATLAGRGGFLPHGYCFSWSPGVLWSMVGADAVIAASYYSIPLALVQFARRRRDIQFNWMLLLFSAFIFACGTTHALAIWVIWQPDYAAEAAVKTLTAAVSLVTAVALWPLLPRLLAQPSTAQLRAVIERLEAEVRQRRTAEESLADVEQTLAATLAGLGAGFIATDRAGRVVRLNEVGERMTGWTQAEAIGQPYWDVFEREHRPPSHRKRSPVEVYTDLAAVSAGPRHLVCVSRDGRRTSVEASASLLYASDGSVRGLAVVLRDLTDEMRAHAESSRLAAIVESSHDAIVGTTLDGHVTSWNAAAERMFGYRADEMLGRPVDALLPPERAGEEERVLEAIARGEAVPPFDTVRRARDGTMLEVLLAASPVRDARGRIVGASKIVHDISNLRRAEEARSRALALQAENLQIQAASRLKSEFLANMSHELRTPLNAIIGFADLMHAGKVPPDSPKHRVFVGHIRNSGRHLLQLINDILDLSKIEAGRLEFEPEPVLLSSLVADVVHLLQEQSAAKSLEVSVQVDPAVEQLVLDARRLKQVLYNYLSNALKFTPPGGRIVVRAGPEPRAAEGGTEGRAAGGGTALRHADGGTRTRDAEGVAARVDGSAGHDGTAGERDGRWRLEVEDTGIGIRAEDLSQLFTEFHQLDRSLAKQHAGTGLGLALTRRLVEAQGGTVGVRSVFGQGSVFHAVLPRVAVAPTADADPGRAEGARGGLDGLSPGPVSPGARGADAAHAAADRAVLVVEDNRRDGGALTEALAGAGFAVAWATTAKAALELTRRRPFVAITLDLQLPDRPGLDLLADIRAAGPNRQTPVLVVTVLGHPLPLEAYAVLDLLGKPVRGDAVVAALRAGGVAVPRGDGSEDGPGSEGGSVPGGGARPVVMVVDDEPEARALAGAALEAAGFEVVAFDGAAAALQALPALRPAAAIVDLTMPGLDGFAMLERLRQMPEGRAVPVLVWTGRELGAEDLRRLRARADAVLSKAGDDLAQALDRVIDQVLEHVREQAQARPAPAAGRGP